jgi:uncharacterized protein
VDLRLPVSIEHSLIEKIDALRQRSAYPGRPDKVVALETHMSWVFLAGDKAYKLKKPVRLPYLDFSTREKREEACRSELSLNRRLAPGVYLDVVPLRRLSGQYQIGGTDGEIHDWLVVMRRLDETHSLEYALAHHHLDPEWLVRLEALLAGFYRRARPASVRTVEQARNWSRSLRLNSSILLTRNFALTEETVFQVERAQRAFLERRSELLKSRLRNRHIVDGHGDLRPEHIFINETISIIDCLEFNASLRATDPFEELAYLAVECERHGMSWAGDHVIRQLARVLPDPAPLELITFYKCYRATLRARLAIAHLLEPDIRDPGKWRPLALSYLGIARKEAVKIERGLTRPKGRAGPDVHGACGSRPRKAAPPGEHRFSRVWDDQAGCGRPQRNPLRQADRWPNPPPLRALQT